MKKRKPDPDYCYRSNYGKGPLEAKIVSIAPENDTVILERRHQNARRNSTLFELSWKFFTSPKCGWIRVMDQRT